MTHIKINQTSCRKHQVKIAKGCYYCRGLHGVLPKEVQFCSCCPFVFNPQEKNIQKRVCYYEDLVQEKTLEELSPEELYGYFEEAIGQERVPVFPNVATCPSPLIKKAYTFAAMAHKGMKRKGTCIPYMSHLMETAKIVSTMTQKEEVVAAALLHDVVEDTPYTLLQIKEEFGEMVTTYVSAESEDKMLHLPAKETWYLRKKNFLDTIGSQPIEVKKIALSDKLSNMRSTIRAYRVIGDKVWERFNQKDKRMHQWYYQGVARELEELCEFEAWQEYSSLCKEIFRNK